MVPLEIHISSPFKTKPPSVGVAKQLSAAASEPDSASDSAKAAILSPVRVGSRYCFFWAALPYRAMGIEPKPCMAKLKSAIAWCSANAWRTKHRARTCKPAVMGLAVAALNGATLYCNKSCSRSEEHTSELQSRGHLVCRLLLE